MQWSGIISGTIARTFRPIYQDWGTSFCSTLKTNVTWTVIPRLYWNWPIMNGSNLPFQSIHVKLHGKGLTGKVRDLDEALAHYRAAYAANLIDGPVLNPLAIPLCYAYPVHTIGADNRPQEAPEQPTYLVVYRNSHYKTGFMNLNPVSARLVEKIRQERHKTGRELLEEIAEELNHPNIDTVVTGGLDTMKQLHAKDILLGTLSAG